MLLLSNQKLIMTHKDISLINKQRLYLKYHEINNQRILFEFSIFSLFVKTKGEFVVANHCN